VSVLASRPTNSFLYCSSEPGAGSGARGQVQSSRFSRGRTLGESPWRSIPTSTALSVRFSSQSISNSAKVRLRVTPELADPIGPLDSR
jgi:hypothetical protein